MANSDSSVNDGYCCRLFSVDTSPSTYFSPFPSRTLPRSTRTMTDSGQLRSSISLLGNHAEFLLSRSTSALNTLQASHALWFLLEEKETSTNRLTDKTQKFLDTRSSISQSASTCLCSGAPRPVGDLAGAATFLSNRKYRCRPYTQPDVGNCWPWCTSGSKLSAVQAHLVTLLIKLLCCCCYFCCDRLWHQHLKQVCLDHRDNARTWTVWKWQGGRHHGGGWAGQFLQMYSLL